VTDIPTGYRGVLSNNKPVNVRCVSSYKTPTLEILINKDKRLKIRYE
jgi:hypothetical protein